MKKLPVITVDEWLQAEEEFRKIKVKPIPEGSFTVIAYAKEKGIAQNTAGHRLKEMYDVGVIDREKHCSGAISFYVYFPKKKKHEKSPV